MSPVVLFEKVARLIRLWLNQSHIRDVATLKGQINMLEKVQGWSHVAACVPAPKERSRKNALEVAQL